MHNGPLTKSDQILCGLLNVTTGWRRELAGLGKASGLTEYGSRLPHKSQTCSGSWSLPRPQQPEEACSALRQRARSEEQAQSLQWTHQADCTSWRARVFFQIKWRAWVFFQIKCVSPREGRPRKLRGIERGF